MASLAPTFASRLNQYLAERESVPGWLDALDVDVLLEMDRFQKTAGMQGDLLEIGVFHGKTSILLGMFAAEGERFVVCDPFEETADLSDANDAENRRYYPDLRRAAFELSYLRFHDQLPVVLDISSEFLDRHLDIATFRLIHVDGCHLYDAVRGDLATSRSLLAPDGLVVFDDIAKPHLPGVGAAVWQAVTSGELIPVALTDAKLYACFEVAPAMKYRDWLLAWAPSRLSTRVDYHPIAGHSVARLVPRPAPQHWES